MRLSCLGGSLPGFAHGRGTVRKSALGRLIGLQRVAAGDCGSGPESSRREGRILVVLDRARDCGAETPARLLLIDAEATREEATLKDVNARQSLWRPRQRAANLSP